MMILITYQQPGCIRSRLVVSADNTFDAIAKVMDKLTTGPAPFDPNTYVAARPATKQDSEQYAFWQV